MNAHRSLSVAVTLASLVVVGLLVLFGIVLPLADWRTDTMARRDAAQTEQTRLQASIGRLEVERQSFVDDDLEGLTWEGVQAAEATAKVQSAG